MSTGTVPHLSREELARFQQGDFAERKAVGQLILERFVPYINSVVRQIRRHLPWMPGEDLFQSGATGLMEFMATASPTEGDDLIRDAKRAIRRHIMQEARRELTWVKRTTELVEEQTPSYCEQDEAELQEQAFRTEIANRAFSSASKLMNYREILALLYTLSGGRKSRAAIARALEIPSTQVGQIVNSAYNKLRRQAMQNILRESKVGFASCAFRRPLL